ncbi:hypothetical protein [Lentibacillus jeotgali]|uniref:hypothetical protein n=1 Tax=Lentibacillus jeotgali TaxID=558169 RepID=UPI0002627842|nr:hypothetical protein [Lentibacillus jeotgali]
MNKDEDYEVDKWDIILSIILVVSLFIGCVIVGILVYEMLEKNQVENALQLKQSIIMRKSMAI